MDVVWKPLGEVPALQGAGRGGEAVGGRKGALAPFCRGGKRGSLYMGEVV